MFFLDVRTLIYFLNLYFLLYFHNRVKIKNCCCCCKFCVFKPFFWRTFLKITFSDGRLLLKDTFYYYYYCSVAVRISNRGRSTNVTSTLAETEGKECFFFSSNYVLPPSSFCCFHVEAKKTGTEAEGSSQPQCYFESEHNKIMACERGF